MQQQVGPGVKPVSQRFVIADFDSKSTRILFRRILELTFERMVALSKHRELDVSLEH
jgi:hypothetical protein